MAGLYYITLYHTYTLEDNNLTSLQKLRYARNIGIAQIGKEGQICLFKSKVAIIGCGALGSIAASYLAGAGVGELLLVDFDTIDISNLQRQVLYAENEAGMSKAETLANRLKSLNSEVNILTMSAMLTRKNGMELLKGADFVIDATDNPASKRLVDDICACLNIPCCIGGISEMSGQLTTCHGASVRYSELFPEAVAEGFTPCSIGGVLGPAAGILACLQAAEAIKYITGAGDVLINKLLTFDLACNQFQFIEL